MKWDEYQNLIGKKVDITAKCDIIPNFHIIGFVLSVSKLKSEYIIKVKSNNKILDIGSNMPDIKIIIL